MSPTQQSPFFYPTNYDHVLKAEFKNFVSLQLAFAHGTQLRLSLLIIWSGFSSAVAVALLLPLVAVANVVVAVSVAFCR